MRKKKGVSWKEPCGCEVDAVRFIKMCPACKKSFDEVSARWDIDFNNRTELPEKTGVLKKQR